MYFIRAEIMCTDTPTDRNTFLVSTTQLDRIRMAGSDNHYTVLHIQSFKPQHTHHIRHQGPSPLPTPVQKVFPHSRSDIRTADHILWREGYLLTEVPRWAMHCSDDYVMLVHLNWWLCDTALRAVLGTLKCLISSLLYCTFLYTSLHLILSLELSITHDFSSVINHCYSINSLSSYYTLSSYPLTAHPTFLLRLYSSSIFHLPFPLSHPPSTPFHSLPPPSILAPSLSQPIPIPPDSPPTHPHSPLT